MISMFILFTKKQDAHHQYHQPMHNIVSGQTCSLLFAFTFVITKNWAISHSFSETLQDYIYHEVFYHHSISVLESVSCKHHR